MRGFLSILWLLIAPVVADGAREVAWEDLVPGHEERIADPFESLTPGQSIDLSMIARIRWMGETGRLSGERTELEEEQRLNNKLTAGGIDVDGLLAAREEIAARRSALAGAVRDDIDGQTIRLPGYVLPLKRGPDGKLTEFLLVPWIGACIHTPPPPPNQMIHVSVPGGTGPRDRFSAIWLEGTIELKPASYSLFLIDGSRQLKVAYTMVSRQISDYSAADSDALAKVDMPDDAFEGNGWFHAWQVKLSLFFTRSMSGLRDDGSSKAFWLAILVAFGYGLVHTLGPGHGKAVVISYFIGDGGGFRRGIAMGVMIAVFHVLSSIVLVLVADFAVRQATGHAPSDYRSIRLGSYALIIAIGAVMLRRAIGASRHSQDLGAPGAGGPRHVDHDHHGCLACNAIEEKKKGTSGWLALAVGVVPCTGALLVLLFGVANDLLFSSILMVAAISAGMAIAMSGIGVLAIVGRRVAFYRMAHDDARRARFSSSLRIGGAALVLMTGTLLFGLAYSGPGQPALPTQSPQLSGARAQAAGSPWTPSSAP